jgi:hypothetical protein
MAIGRKEKVSGTPVVSARASVFLVGARTHGQHWDEGQQSSARLARLVAHVSNDDRWRWEERHVERVSVLWVRVCSLERRPTHIIAVV